MKRISGRPSETVSRNIWKLPMHTRISTISRKDTAFRTDGQSRGETAHAVLSAIDVVDGPFAVINADDYYGSHAFQVIYDYLTTHEDDDRYRYTMVGYRLKNTVTDNGYVSRGICELNSDRELVSVTERTRIEKKRGRHRLFRGRRRDLDLCG